MLFYYSISIETLYLYKSISFTATCTSVVLKPFHPILTHELSHIARGTAYKSTGASVFFSIIYINIIVFLTVLNLVGEYYLSGLSLRSNALGVELDY